MKSILPTALLFVSLISTVSAITDAEIAPAALVGKTLVFTIVNGGSPYATTGTWSGAFAATGNGFTVTNVTGDTVNISTTFAAAVTGSFTDVSLPKFIEGQKPATLTLYTVGGVGNYEVSIQDLFGVSLNGTFVFGTTPVKTPEIGVQQPVGSNLTDGAANKSFGTVKVGKTGKAKVFTIKNSGNATLSGLSIKADGKHKSNFIVGALGKTSLATGASTTFKVSFKPSSKGTRKAAIHIASNDKNENPFDITLTGEGAAK